MFKNKACLMDCEQGDRRNNVISSQFYLNTLFI